MAEVLSEFEHPITACVRAIAGLLEGVVDCDPIYPSTRAKAAALAELKRVEDRLRGLTLRVLATADDVALDDGSRSAAAWLAHETRRDRGPTAADARLGAALEERWPQTRAAVLAGDVNLEQARVIVAALEALPSDLDPELVAKAEAHLVAEAGHFDPHHLRLLGRRVLEVVAPALVEDHQRRALEAEERRAREANRLVLRKRGDGITDIKITVPDQVAAKLRTYLEAYASPRRGHLDPSRTHTDPESGQRIPYPVLMGRAFCSLLEAVPAKLLPQHGGSATTVVVALDFDRLAAGLGAAGLGAAGLSSGEQVSASEAIRLACTANLVPMVLGGTGQPLHLGRGRRLFSAGQRLAMTVRDQHCRAEGCDVPAAWCEAHHAKGRWAVGGKTDIEDGALLCSWHHHRAHDPDYRTGRMPNGDLRFHRRC